MFSTQSRFWLILPLLAFLVFPSQALHYGLFDSTAKEILVAIGWRSVNITWLWFLPLLAIEFFKHPKAKIGFLVAFLHPIDYNKEKLYGDSYDNQIPKDFYNIEKPD